MPTQTLELECESCDGTGLYRGMAEPPGVAVVCLQCQGSGCLKRTLRLFTKRKKRSDVKTVRRSRGSLLALGVGPVGGSVTYEEFLTGKLP